jgi:hypothetical protein
VPATSPFGLDALRAPLWQALGKKIESQLIKLGELS